VGVAITVVGAGVAGGACGVFVHPLHATSSTSATAVRIMTGSFMYDDLPFCYNLFCVRNTLQRGSFSEQRPFIHGSAEKTPKNRTKSIPEQLN
jgi:hypothetical protein